MDIHEKIAKYMVEGVERIDFRANANLRCPPYEYANLIMQDKIINRLDTLVKLELYNLTNEALKTKLKEDFSVSEEDIKLLKNKKELVDKIIEVM